jgi:cellulase/cellobiase CelA1
VNATIYTSFDYRNKLDKAAALNPKLKCQIEDLKTYGMSTWIDTMKNIALVEKSLIDAEQQAQGKNIVVQFVVYDLPGRDCAAL